VEVLHPLDRLERMSHGLVVEPRHLLELVGVSAERDELQDAHTHTHTHRSLTHNSRVWIRARQCIGFVLCYNIQVGTHIIGLVFVHWSQVVSYLIGLVCVNSLPMARDGQGKVITDKPRERERERERQTEYSRIGPLW